MLSKWSDKRVLSGILGFTTGLVITVVFILVSGAGYSSSDIGRYQISAGTDEHGVYILDTTDGHLWQRHGTSYRDFGTPDEPIYKSRKLSR